MAFNYSVLSYEQAMQERYQLLKEGEYDAIVFSSEDRVSATGNPMMALTLNVYDDAGKPHQVRDFLVFTPKMMWKVIHFADSCGKLMEYEDGKLCSNIVSNVSLRVKISIEKGGEIPHDKLQGKISGAKYPDKNKVDDYVKQGEIQISSVNAAHIDDDEVPF